MLSKRLTYPVLVAAFAGCAPTVTIADGTSGAAGDGATASGGNAATGGTSGGSLSSGGTSTGGSSSGGASTDGGSNGVCYTGGGMGAVIIPCDDLPNGGSSSGSGGTSFAGSGGTGSGLPPSCAQPIEPYIANVGCDVPSSLRYCAKSGCHGATAAAGNLNLVADDFLIARLLNVQARFEYSGFTEPPSSTQCLARECPTEALLLNQASPEESWMLRKMDPFVPGVTTTTTDMGCGKAMPTFDTTGTAGYSAEAKDCLIQFFTRLAVEGEPCTPAGTAPPERPPLCPEDG